MPRKMFVPLTVFPTNGPSSSVTIGEAKTVVVATKTATRKS